MASRYLRCAPDRNPPEDRRAAGTRYSGTPAPLPQAPRRSCCEPPGIIAVGQLGDQLRPVGPEEMDHGLFEDGSRKRARISASRPGLLLWMASGTKFSSIASAKSSCSVHRPGIHAGRTARYLLKQEQDGKIAAASGEPHRSHAARVSPSSRCSERMCVTCL